MKISEILSLSSILSSVECNSKKVAIELNQKIVNKEVQKNLIKYLKV